MNYEPVPNLERIAMMKVALLLYNNPELRKVYYSRFVSPTDFVPTEYIDRIHLIDDRISRLFLPELLQERLLVITFHVDLWLFKLFELHKNVSSMFGECQCFKGILERDSLSMTHGILDGRKTLSKLACDQEIDLAFRFTLASGLYMDNIIIAIFEQMPLYMKFRFCKSDVPIAIRSLAEYLFDTDPLKPWKNFMSFIFDLCSFCLNGCRNLMLKSRTER
ncbi:unnamed protein product [Larinioides sclopetarius]|uniref:Uncharacterized protein n=1 Tax=Larinioides sclopetarius TaxID=280406 RepID=A0AAV2BP44_9ARAC